MPLDTLDNVKSQLGVTTTADDTLLGQLQAAADAFIAAFCGRDFAGGAFTEDHPGGVRAVFLRNYPMAAVDAVRVDPARQFDPATTLDPTTYLVHADRGVVESLGGPFVPSRPGWPVRPFDFPGAVRVTYSTPTGQVPGAVLRAYAELVGHWYRQVKTHVSTGHLNLTFQADGTGYPWGQATGYRVPEGILQLLRPYRVPGA